MAVQLLERRLGIAARREQSGFLRALRRLDLLLITSALALSAIGIVMVYSATRSSLLSPDPTFYAKRQLVYVVLGVIAMVIAMVIDYHRFEEWCYLIYGGSFLALMAVRAVGKSNQGAAREIAIGPLAIQPSEFAVLSIIVVVAVFIHRHEDALGPKNLAKLVGLVFPPVALVYLEPDLGTTMITFVIFVTMMVVGGVRLRYLGLLALGIVTVFVVGAKVHLLHDYQIERLSSFLHQDDCAKLSASQAVSCFQNQYQLDNAKAAIGAGGLKGTGLLNGAVTNTGFVPYAYADMIFSAVGEQLGFLGSTVVLGLFGIISLRMFRAIQTAKDTLGRLFCAGALAFLVFSVFQNVGMNVGIMPITGIPLPFLSFGGSALFATFASVGLVANVEMRRSRVR